MLVFKSGAKPVHGYSNQEYLCSIRPPLSTFPLTAMLICLTQYRGMLDTCRLYLVICAIPKWPAGSLDPLGRKESDMAESVYKMIELVGTSTESWEKAAAAAVEMASKTLRDLRIAEVVELDMQLENGKVVNYRAKVRVSFKIERAD